MTRASDRALYCCVLTLNEPDLCAYSLASAILSEKYSAETVMAELKTAIYKLETVYHTLRESSLTFVPTPKLENHRAGHH